MTALRSALWRPLVYRLLTVLLVLGGVMAAGGYAWLLVQRPEPAAQVTAVLVIGANILLALYHPAAGLALWLFLTPFAPFLPFNIAMPAGVPDLGFTRVVGAFLVLYLLAEIARGRRRAAPVTAVEVAVPFFALSLLIAAFRSINGWLWAVQSAFDSLLMPLLAWFITRQVIRSTGAWRGLLATALAVTAIIAVLTISEQLTGYTLFRVASTSVYYTAGVRKVAAVLGNPAYIAVTLALVLPFALDKLADTGSWPQRWLYGGLVVLYGLAIYLTYNRSGWLAGLLVLVVMAVLSPRWRWRVLPWLAVAGVGLALVWNNLQDTAAGQRLTASSPLDYRLQALEMGLRLHRQDPVLGIGWGSFGRLAVQNGLRLGANIHVLPTTHNTYLHLLVSGGYLLLGSYLLVIGGLILTLWQVGRRYRQRRRSTPSFLPATWGAACAYLVATAGFDNYFAIYTNIVFWTLMAAAVSRTQALLEVS